MSPNAVYATLLTTISYLPGALVLDQSLRSVKSQYPLVVMVTPKVPQEARTVLNKRGIVIKEVEYLQPEEGVHSLGGYDSRFGDTWTKLRSVMTLIDLKEADIYCRGFDLYDYDV